MAARKPQVMWPRLVASKIFKNTLSGNKFVADFPSNYGSVMEIPPYFSINNDSISEETTTNFNVFVSTWNVGGVTPSEDVNMDDLIDQSNPCDVYVFGFQEVVPLRVENVLESEKSKVYMKWNSIIRRGLMKMENMNNNNNNSKGVVNSGFKCIISKQMVGIFVSAWVRAGLLPYVTGPAVSCVGCGVMGCLGNKGSISLRFRLHETTFCFVCTHLASGGREGDLKYRNSNAAEILSRTIFPKTLDKLPRRILDHDRVIFLGDMNYRISLPESATRLLVNKGDWNALLKHDQLKRELMEGEVFEGWYEGVITFAPTYKYYPNSDEYYGKIDAKSPQKKRAPAWCDRIIWHGEGLKQHEYKRVESKLSDHRPVRAIFSTKVPLKLKFKPLQNFFLSDRFTHSSLDLHYATDHFSCDSSYTLQFTDF